MKRAFVTGASGFIGRHAVEALVRRGFDVYAATREPLKCSTLFGAGIAVPRVELLDGETAKSVLRSIKPSHLLLCAWTTEHGKYWDDPMNQRWVQVTEMLAREFFVSGGERAVLVGTCAEYDWTDPAMAMGAVAEDAAQGIPATKYGRAKRRAAKILTALGEDYGGQTAVGRIFFAAGAGEDRRRFLPTVINAILSGRPAQLGPGDQVRDLVDVRDVGAALAAILDCDATGALNVGSGNGLRLGDVAKLAGDLLGRPDLLRLGALPKPAGEPPAIVANISRLIQATGLRPSHGINDTVIDAIEFWRRAAVSSMVS